MACLLVLLVIGLDSISRMPGESHSGPLPPLTNQERLLRGRLEGHVRMLAGTIGERNLWHYPALSASASYIEQTFARQGYRPESESFESRGKTVRNIIAEKPGRPGTEAILLVGAHYDTVLGSPGANDNGSGVAALLELAGLFADSEPDCTLRFVAFVNEESPFSRSHEMGSLVNALATRTRGERIDAMLSLETIGYYSDRPNSQHYPFPLSYLYPRTADFIGFVGNLGSRALVRGSVRAFRRHAEFPSEGAAVPAWIRGVGWSDHWSFWQVGYPAIMVTDTAFFRYAYYHGAEDTPDKLDYERMGRVVEGLAGVVRELAAASRGDGDSAVGP